MGQTKGASNPSFGVRLAGFAALLLALAVVLPSLSPTLDCEPQKDDAQAAKAATPVACTFCTEPAPPAKDCNLCVTQNPLMFANTSGAASTTLRLCNSGPDEPQLKLALSAWDVPVDESKVYGLLPPLPTFAAVADADRDVVNGKAVFTKGQCVLLKVDAGGLNKPGVHAARLANGEQTLAKLKAVRLEFPFALHGGAKNDRLDAAVGRDGKLTIPIYNDDPIPYRFAWRLELDGAVRHGVQRVEGRGRIDLEPQPGLVKACLLESGFLRSGARSGKLFLRHEPDPSFVALDTKHKVLDVGVKVSYFTPNAQRLFNILGILGVLLAGIGASLLLNYAWPMYRRRFRIKQRLGQQDGRLAGMGRAVPARLLSLMRIEKRRVREELRNRWSIDPETEAALDTLEPRMEALGRRIELTARAGDLLGNIEADPLLAQHEFDEAERLARQVFEVAAAGSASAADLERAEAALVAAAALRARRDSDPSTAALEALRKRAEAVGKKAPFQAHNNPDPALVNLRELAERLREAFPKDGEASRDRFVDAASAVAKCELIEGYSALLASADDTLRARRLARGGDLLAALRPGADAATRLGAARRVLDEIEQNVDGNAVVKALRDAPPGSLAIEVDPPTPRDYQLVGFRVRLAQPGLDEAVARGRVRWRWTIDGEPLGDGDDWTAWHFFEPQGRGARLQRWLARALGMGSAEAGPRELEVAAQAFERYASGGPIVTAPQRAVRIEGTKTYGENALMIAVVSLAITVLLAATALIATAQEKIQALDWMTGVVVVFGLGFAADVLKRAVTKPAK